jgi:hypothetical protein
VPGVGGVDGTSVSLPVEVEPSRVDPPRCCDMVDDPVEGLLRLSRPLKPFQLPHSPSRLVCAGPPNRCPSTWKTGSSSFSHGGISAGSAGVDVGVMHFGLIGSSASGESGARLSTVWRTGESSRTVFSVTAGGGRDEVGVGMPACIGAGMSPRDFRKSADRPRRRLVDEVAPLDEPLGESENEPRILSGRRRKTNSLAYATVITTKTMPLRKISDGVRGDDESSLCLTEG